MKMLEKRSQSVPQPETIPEAIQSYVGGRIVQYPTAGNSTETAAIESILKKAREAYKGENIPDIKDDGPEAAIENAYISKQLLEQHNEFPTNALLHIAARLSKIMEILKKLTHRDEKLISMLQKELSQKKKALIDETAKHLKNPDRRQDKKIKLEETLKIETTELLKKVEVAIEFILNPSFS